MGPARLAIVFRYQFTYQGSSIRTWKATIPLALKSASTRIKLHLRDKTWNRGFGVVIRVQGQPIENGVSH